MNQSKPTPPGGCGPLGRPAGGAEAFEGFTQIGLKCSNGSPQARQRYSALQAVEPNADSRSVSALAQRGHGSAAAARRGTKRSATPWLGSRRARRRDAVLAQLAPALGADPVGGPGRRALQPHLDRAEARVLERLADVGLDHLGRRAARVGRRQHDLEAVGARRSRRARCRGRRPRRPAPPGRARRQHGPGTRHAGLGTLAAAARRLGGGIARPRQQRRQPERPDGC